jgi:NAD-dependent deacetylase
MFDQGDLAARKLADATSIFVLTGAGMSSESGLPTFRGVRGLWRTHRVEDLASEAGFARDPVLVWTWYNERRAAHRLAGPNAGHDALVTLERNAVSFTLATQNVDSLHLRAGSGNVLELHGHLREARCDRCRVRRPLDGDMLPSDIGHDCGGRFRPDIVWFGEALPERTWQAAAEAAARADVVLVVGTSGVVEPAASLATRVPGRGAFVIEVNPEDSAITPRADVALRGPAAVILPRLVETAANLSGSYG